MMKLKACPRYKGDLIVDSDRYVWSENCLQCGYELELRSLAATRLTTGEVVERAKSV